MLSVSSKKLNEMENILFEVRNEIAYVTINRPDKLNALNFETLIEIKEVFLKIYESKEIRGVILTGSGEKAFVAGADITQFLTITPEKGKSFSEQGQMVFQLIEDCPKPVIAAINGYALGGGCELELACHLRVLSENAQLGQPEVNLGIVPGYGGTQRLTHLVGRGKALEWMITADMISSKEALNWGLANHVVSQAELIPTCEAILKKVKSKSPVAVTEAINATNGYFLSHKHGYALEAEAFSRCINTKDFREGVTAFLEKRKPNFTGE